MNISKDVIHREIAGDHILVPIGEIALRHSGVFAVTALGAEIWEMLATGKEYEAIIAELLDEYEVEEYVLKRDVDEFLAKLREDGLITD